MLHVHVAWAALHKHLQVPTTFLASLLPEEAGSVGGATKVQLQLLHMKPDSLVACQSVGAHSGVGIPATRRGRISGRCNQATAAALPRALEVPLLGRLAHHGCSGAQVSLKSLSQRV